jgi:hypothetical protein
VTLDQPVLTFGRRGDFVLDPVDRQLHRDLGELHVDADRVVLKNVGRALVLHVRHPTIDRGGVVPLHPGTNMELRSDLVEIGVEARSSYVVGVRLDPGGARRPIDMAAPTDADTVLAGEGVRLTPRERQVLALLCESRLRTGGQSGSVPSNRVVADRLVVRERTVEAFVSAIFSKFVADGVRELAYDATEPVAARRLRLVELAVRLQVVTVEDLPPFRSPG